jgi:hypothetical protein
MSRKDAMENLLFAARRPVVYPANAEISRRFPHAAQRILKCRL